MIEREKRDGEAGKREREGREERVIGREGGERGKGWRDEERERYTRGRKRDERREREIEKEME